MINCKDIADSIINITKTVIEDNNIRPCIAIILVGNNSASQVYVKNKIKRCNELKISYKLFTLDTAISTADLLVLIDNLNQDKSVHAILVQMPLPNHIDDKLVINSIAHEKDVDGFSYKNFGLLLQGKFDVAILPCTPKGIIYLIDFVLQKEPNDFSKNKYAGLVCIILGRSDIVGKPLAAILINLGATVISCNRNTENIDNLLSIADIVIVAIGSANAIDLSVIKEKALVIDVGINLIEEKICGDIVKKKIIGDINYNQEIIDQKNLTITPVPKGVGLMTVAMLMNNILNCYSKCIRYSQPT